MQVDLSNLLLKCAHCKLCYAGREIFLPICPSAQKYGFEAFRSSGRSALVKSLLEGRLEFSPKLAEIFYACTVCGACAEQCPLGYDAVTVFEAIRAEIVKRGFGPLPRQKVFVESIIKNHNPYREPHEKRTSWIPKTLNVKKKAEILYFVGCTSSYRTKNIAEATVNVLERLKIDFCISPEEWCCGSPAIRVGVLDIVDELLRHNLKLIKEAGVKKVIFSCAGCYRTFKKDYPRFFKELDFEILHVSEFLSQLIEKEKIKMKEYNKTITYHDPCHLGRHCDIYDPPREILNSIPKVRLLEMPRNRENSWCCGAGGGVKSGLPQFALETGIERVKEAEETGAEILVSTCPFCYRNLVDACKSYEPKITVADLMEILSKVLQ